MTIYLFFSLIICGIGNYQYNLKAYDHLTLDMITFQDSLGLIIQSAQVKRDIYTALQTYTRPETDYASKATEAYVVRLDRMQQAAREGITIQDNDTTLLATLVTQFTKAGGRGDDLKKLLQRQLILKDMMDDTLIVQEFGQDKLDAIIDRTFTETTKLMISVVQFWREKLITQKLLNKTISEPEKKLLEAMQSQLRRDFETNISQLPSAKGASTGPLTSIKEFLGTRAYVLRVAYTISAEDRDKKNIPIDFFISNLTDDGNTLVFLGSGRNKGTLKRLSRNTMSTTTRQLSNTQTYMRLNHGRNIAIISKAIPTTHTPYTIELLDINTDTTQVIPGIDNRDAILNVSSDMSAAIIQRGGQAIARTDNIFAMNTTNGAAIQINIPSHITTNIPQFSSLTFYISNNGTHVLVTQPMAQESRNLVHIFSGISGQHMKSFADNFSSLSSADISANGAIVGGVVKDYHNKELIVWKLPSGKRIQNMKMFKEPYMMLSSEGEFIASILEYIPVAENRLPDFTFLIITRYGQVITETARPQGMITDTKKGVAAMAASQNLRWIAAQMGDGTITVWHLEEVGGMACSLSDTVTLFNFQALFVPQTKKTVYLTTTQKDILNTLKERGCLIPEDWEKRIRIREKITGDYT